MIKELKNKKIVMMVVNDFTHDSRVLKEALSAARAGMKVWVLARKSSSTKARERKNGISIIRVQTISDRFGAKVLPSKGKEIGGSQSTGAKIPQPLQVYFNLFNLWLINRRFIDEAKKIKPDLVHANDSSTLLAAYRLKKHGYRIVYDAHELYSESVVKPHWLWKKIFVYFEMGLKKVDGIFSVCQSILDEIDKRYQTGKLSRAILYNAPFYIKTNFNMTKKPIRLVYVGNKSKSRDLSKLFKAVMETKGVTLTNIGPGWEEKTVGKIQSMPAVKPEIIINTIRQFDIGIIPYIDNNLNQHYSTPNKLFEYMMAGLAIAASDLPEVSKIIDEVENGVLFNPRSTKDITAKLNYLIKNKKILAKFKQNSLKFSKKYSWENQEKKQLKLYEEILEKC